MKVRIFLLVVLGLFIFKSGNSEVIEKSTNTEPSGLEWIEVKSRENGEVLIGATSISGKQLIPSGDHIIYFKEEMIQGKYYGFFEVNECTSSGKWVASLYSPRGEKLVENNRYKTFLWSDNKIVGAGPNGYENINIPLNRFDIDVANKTNVIPDFKEATTEFFASPNSYSIKQNGNNLTGDFRMYKRGETTLTIGKNTYTLKFKDGSRDTANFTPTIKNVTVLRSDGQDSILPVFIDFENYAIRAIRNSNGEYTVFRYLYNYPSKKYILFESYVLY